MRIEDAMRMRAEGEAAAAKLEAAQRRVINAFMNAIGLATSGSLGKILDATSCYMPGDDLEKIITNGEDLLEKCSEVGCVGNKAFEQAAAIFETAADQMEAMVRDWIKQ